MNEWFKKTLTQIKTLWGKWTPIQKGILAAVIVAAVVIIVLLASWSAKPSLVPLIDTPVTDATVRERIVLRLNEENVKATVSQSGIISVNDEQTARRMRAILLREDLIPQNTDPWALFDVERWTRTDFERNIDVRRAVIEEVRKHIKALDDVDDASVVVNLPEDKLFQADQNPVTASVILYPKPGSDISTNRKKIEGIQKLLKYAVEGLTDDNITIADNSGNILNDFAGLKDFDRLSIIEKQQKIIAKLETQYEIKILNILQKTYGTDRVRDLSIKIDMDMSEKTAETVEYLPFQLRADNPETPYDESEVRASVTRSSETATTTYQGTGFNPEGPAGVEGQTAPSYKDTSNLTGLSTQSIVKTNEEIGSRRTSEIVSPEMGRRTVSVNIDGQWRKKKDANGNLVIKDGQIEREYIPIPDDELQKATQAVQAAIGYSALRNDSVSVLNIQFDRLAEFEKEDNAYFRSVQRQRILLISLAGLALLLLIFIVYRIVSREIERRKRLREEELLRQHQLEREKALWEAEQAGMEVSMSVEEMKRRELLENVINNAREHPEDVALLLRTWLMEE
ncbi:flagellar M-ring protein FliF [Treponema vincentii F0403]|uniref:Flagellar M-ring protein FliF n=1 Tax=Treponema vincentii F0403 TaxID=1125702 RepID=S3LC03_9SPIR|nr:flagellar basal-body MS-ring/collar protein FliF [Treponema vincentii]EPF47973.1 flagellar M-ring protein FliF [Treponema vincentii F0403]UTC46085.1 flagellar M-ring protein FliF [Treponema vincentii]